MASQVPLNDLSRLDSDLKQKIAEKVALLSVSGNYILGPEVSAFEKELANYIGAKDVVGVASGTDALILALLSLGLGPSDTVLTMANAGSYTTVAAKAIGAEPLFVDVSDNRLQMSAQELARSLQLAQKAGLKPKLVVVTHLFGQLNGEMAEIMKVAEKADLLVVEDCAQALGARSEAGMAGSFGNLATFSFYPTKNLGASGDGGAISGSDQGSIDKVRKLRQYGWGAKYSIEHEGGRNSRLDELQAAILRLKLPQLDAWNKKRREIYARYQAAAHQKVMFYSLPTESYVGHLAPITVSGKSQAKLAEYFLEHGIQTSIHFPTPDHKQKIAIKYRELVDLPVTEESCSNHVTLPIFPEMTEQEISTVCEALSKVCD